MLSYWNHSVSLSVKWVDWVIFPKWFFRKIQRWVTGLLHTLLGGLPQAMYVVIMYQLQINIWIRTCMYIGSRRSVVVFWSFGYNWAPLLKQFANEFSRLWKNLTVVQLISKEEKKMSSYFFSSSWLHHAKIFINFAIMQICASAEKPFGCDR